MKKTAWYCGALVLAVLNAVYLALTADSFYLEYVKDEFVYWGYPQWGCLFRWLLTWKTRCKGVFRDVLTAVGFCTGSNCKNRADRKQFADA